MNAADAANLNLGFGHFIGQSDAVGKTLLAILVLMSVASWAIIIARAGQTIVPTETPVATEAAGTTSEASRLGICGLIS